MRLRALRPDEADAHVALESVLAFDLVANLVELDEADRAGFPGQVWPDFALFEVAEVRGIVERVLTDPSLRAAVLPGRDERGAAQLLVELDRAAGNVRPDERIWTGSFTPDSAAVLRTLGVDLR